MRRTRARSPKRGASWPPRGSGAYAMLAYRRCVRAPDRYAPFGPLAPIAGHSHRDRYTQLRIRHRVGIPASRSGGSADATVGGACSRVCAELDIAAASREDYPSGADGWIHRGTGCRLRARASSTSPATIAPVTARADRRRPMRNAESGCPAATGERATAGRCRAAARSRRAITLPRDEAKRPTPFGDALRGRARRGRGNAQLCEGDDGEDMTRGVPEPLRSAPRGGQPHGVAGVRVVIAAIALRTWAVRWPATSTIESSAARARRRRPHRIHETRNQPPSRARVNN